MALVKNRIPIAQLVASGTSAVADVSSGVGLVAAIRHSNGTGTITTVATAQIQYQLKDGTIWHSPPSLLVSFSSIAATIDYRHIAIPDAAISVRVVYVTPVGATGATLDVEIGSVIP